MDERTREDESKRTKSLTKEQIVGQGGSGYGLYKTHSNVKSTGTQNAGENAFAGTFLKTFPVLSLLRSLLSFPCSCTQSYLSLSASGPGKSDDRWL